MLKRGMLITPLLFFILIPLANAQYVVLNDTFTRTNLYPWGKIAVTCYSDVDIYNNAMRDTAEQYCLASACYNFDTQNKTVLENFTVDWNYYFASDSVCPDSVIVMGWYENGKGTTIVFHPWGDEVIVIKDGSLPTSTSVWEDYFSTEAYPPGTYLTIPHDFVWAEGNWYPLRVRRTGDRLELWENNTLFFNDTMPDFTWNNMVNLCLGYVVENTTTPYANGWALHDNVVVQTPTTPKEMPELTLTFSPDWNVTVGTQVTTSCSADVPVTLHLYDWNNVEVSNPYTYTYTETGDYDFTCRSEATAQYYEAETFGYVHVYSVPVVTPTVVTKDATDVGRTYAILNGEIIDTGNELNSKRGFYWGTESGVYPYKWFEEGSFDVGSFSHKLEDLDPDTKYYFKAFSCNSAGCGNGTERSFKTGTPPITKKYNITWDEPVVNVTDLEEAGITWMTPLFTPFFLVLLVMFSITGTVAYASRSPVVGAIVFLGLVLTFIWVGMFPTWIGVLIVVIGGLLVGYMMTGTLRGGK